MNFVKSGACIGVVREHYSTWERRAPFTPAQVARIVNSFGIEVRIQPCRKRIYSDNEYLSAGARVTNDLSPCNTIFGVKQVPKDLLINNKTYLFFSHTIKGQSENMPLLDEVLRKNVRLIDYECITRDGKSGSQRLVAFGEYAGKAGMIDTLRGVGQQLLCNKGISSPFLNIGSAYMYPSYDSASKAVKVAGEEFLKRNEESLSGRSVAIADQTNPLVFLFTGSGKVFEGAKQLFNVMPHVWVHPDDLASPGFFDTCTSPIIGCHAQLSDMVERISDGGFQKSEFYEEPHLYKSTFFSRLARKSNALINCMYWDKRYPRVVTKDDLARTSPWADRKATSSRLHFIADLSCDVQGGIESLDATTSIEDPFMTVVNPPLDADREVRILGVDILPSELPREATKHFGDHLLPFVPQLAQETSTKDLAPELRGACVAENGVLSEKFRYINTFKLSSERETNQIRSPSKLQVEGSTVLRIQGHLFDTGLVNTLLDVIEAEPGSRFHIVECIVGPNRKSTVLLQITLDGGRKQLDDIIVSFAETSKAVPEAQAIIDEMPQSFCDGNFSSTLKQDRLPVSEKDSASGYNGVAHDTTTSSFEVNRYANAGASLETVLVLGAGMVARPCAELLSRDTSRNVLVCSAIPGEAEALCEAIGKSNVHSVLIDVSTEKDRLDRLIGLSQLVISLLPATMHADIARRCIFRRSKLVTASYVSPEMKELSAEAEQAGVPILCEMGLDPGIDHMSAMAIIDELKSRGEEITSFRSVCGGLTAPEFADNPFGYKFTWSPAGVLHAMMNDATFLQDDTKQHIIGGAPLMGSASPLRIHMLPSLALEEIPNRDSLVYAEKYGIPTATTCVRGTLRYQGFCEIFRHLIEAGFMKDNVSFSVARKEFFSNVGDPKVKSAVEWLFSDMDEVDSETPAMNKLCSLLQDKLSLKPSERDMCVMQHTFNENIFATLLVLGDGDSGLKATAMAKTVGYTAAIGAELLLDTSLDLGKRGGIMLPIEKNVYQPALERLEMEGIRFRHFRS